MTKKIDNIPDEPRLKYLDEFILPYNFSFKNTTVGGLSGIDYDDENGIFYLICDDASVINPVRFYTAQILIDNNKIDTIVFNSVTHLRNREGEMFSSSKLDPGRSADPEALRIDKKTGQLVWSSEGERRLHNGQSILGDALIYISEKNGNFIDSFPLSENLKMKSTDNGPRHNSVFEGISINRDELIVSVEEPLFEDGQPAGTGDSSAWVRFVKYDLGTRMAVAQYAYQIEPVANIPDPPGAFRLNGVSEILHFDDTRLLVIERSYSTGHKVNLIRVFLADFKDASDISPIRSLKDTDFKPLKKKLLATIKADNIEGVCFGPRLSNGRRSLIFVSDNNFSPTQVTQFLLYEIE